MEDVHICACCARERRGACRHHGTRVHVSVHARAMLENLSRCWCCGLPLQLDSAGRVYIGAQDSTVFALSASTGEVVWRSNVTVPEPAQGLPVTPTIAANGTLLVTNWPSVFALQTLSTV